MYNQFGGQYRLNHCNDPYNFIKNYDKCVEEGYNDDTINSNKKVLIISLTSYTGEFSTFLCQLYNTLIFKNNIKREDIFGIFGFEMNLKIIDKQKNEGTTGDAKIHEVVRLYHTGIKNIDNESKKQLSFNRFTKNNSIDFNGLDYDGLIDGVSVRELLADSDFHCNTLFFDIYNTYKQNYLTNFKYDSIDDRIGQVRKFCKKFFVESDDVVIFFNTHGDDYEYSDVELKKYGNKIYAEEHFPVGKIYDRYISPISEQITKTGSIIYIPLYCRHSISNKHLFEYIDKIKKSGNELPPIKICSLISTSGLTTLVTLAHTFDVMTLFNEHGKFKNGIQLLNDYADVLTNIFDDRVDVAQIIEDILNKNDNCKCKCSEVVDRALVELYSLNDDPYGVLYRFVYFLKTNGMDENDVKSLLLNSSLSRGCDLTTSSRELDVISLILHGHSDSDVLEQINLKYIESVFEDIKKNCTQIISHLTDMFPNMTKSIYNI